MRKLKRVPLSERIDGAVEGLARSIGVEAKDLYICAIIFVGILLTFALV